MSKTLVLIPSRMASTRLPEKPMAMIGGRPMILHVLDRAREAAIGRAVVCTDSKSVYDAVIADGGEAVMTSPDHPSGSDRIFEAMQELDPGETAETIVNLQGDLPALEPRLLAACLAPLGENRDCDIATLAAAISVPAEADDPNVVKVVGTPIGENRLRALYFTRARAPHGEGPLYHHIGLYAYRRAALSRFVDLPVSALERREKLEQLRALENGMRIDVALVDTVPHGVDTPGDLEKARRLLAVGGDTEDKERGSA